MGRTVRGAKSPDTHNIRPTPSLMGAVESLLDGQYVQSLQEFSGDTYQTSEGGVLQRSYFHRLLQTQLL